MSIAQLAEMVQVVKNAQAMRPVLVVRKLKADDRRFTGKPLTGFGAL